MTKLLMTTVAAAALALTFGASRRPRGRQMGRRRRSADHSARMRRRGPGGRRGEAL